eukprot:scaffold14590_cov20-Tisochrysis_lutea.AAC.3
MAFKLELQCQPPSSALAPNQSTAACRWKNADASVHLHAWAGSKGENNAVCSVWVCCKFFFKKEHKVKEAHLHAWAGSQGRTQCVGAALRWCKSGPYQHHGTTQGNFNVEGSMNLLWSDGYSCDDSNS